MLRPRFAGLTRAWPFCQQPRSRVRTRNVARRSYRPQPEALEARIALAQLQVISESGSVSYNISGTSLDGISKSPSKTANLNQGRDSFGLENFIYAEPGLGYGGVFTLGSNTNTQYHINTQVMFSSNGIGKSFSGSGSGSGTFTFKILPSLATEGVGTPVGVQTGGILSPTGTGGSQKAEASWFRSPSNGSSPMTPLSNNSIDYAEVGDTLTFEFKTSASLSQVLGEASAAISGLGFRLVAAPPKPLPDISMDSLDWSPNGGVDFAYSISNTALPSTPTVSFYWASGDTFDKRIGGPVHSIPAQTAVGSSGTVHVGASALGTPPQAATHLLVVADPPSAGKPQGNISESDEGNNVKAVRIPTDLVAQKLEWNVQAGGITATYDVKNAAVPGDLTINFWWVGPNNQRKAELTEFRFVAKQGTGAAQRGDGKALPLSAIKTLPPAGTTGLMMVLDSGKSIVEASESNNELVIEYKPDFEILARWDGDESKDIIGRFFRTIAINDQFAYFDLPDSLATLKPTEVSVTLGNRTLKATGTGGKSYRTENFDPGTLDKDSVLEVVVKNGLTILHTEQVTIDIESIPDWLDQKLSNKVFSFDTANGRYKFIGDLLKFSTSTLAGFALPGNVNIKDDNWFGIGQKSGIDASATLEIRTGLNPTVKPDYRNVHLDVSLMFLGRSVYKNDFNSSAGGPLTLTIDVEPRNLDLINARLKYEETSDKYTVDVLKDQTYTKGFFSLTSGVQASLIHKLMVDVTFDPSGAISNSSIGFDLDGTLSGNFIDVSILPSQAQKAKNFIQAIVTKSNATGILLSWLTKAAQNLGVLPDARIRAGVKGNLNLSGRAKLVSAQGAQFDSLKGNIDLGIDADVAMTWDIFFDEKKLFGLPKAMTDMLKISRKIP